jgi:hypothetical protein
MILPFEPSETQIFPFSAAALDIFQSQDRDECGKFLPYALESVLRAATLWPRAHSEGPLQSAGGSSAV